MTVRVYSSDDTSAPTLSGAIGALIAVLDACLVNGYGAKTAAGWTKEFSGTNKAAYKQGAGSNAMRLRVDDSTTATSRVRGYEVMTDVDTGTGLFPTDAQLAGGGYILKSSTTDSTARPWMLIATEKAFHLYIGYSDTAFLGAGSSARQMYFFGDCVSNKVGDAFATLLICGTNSSTANSYYGHIPADISTAVNGHFIARSYTQIGTSVLAAKAMDGRANVNSTIGAASPAIAYPDPVSGGMLLSPVYVLESAVRVPRATLPGVWGPLHSMPAQHGESFSGSGALAGKSFVLLNCSNGSSAGRVAIETSNTW